jgi:hypothetical protein
MIKGWVRGGFPPSENIFHLHSKWCILRHFKVVYKCMNISGKIIETLQNNAQRTFLKRKIIL